MIRSAIVDRLTAIYERTKVLREQRARPSSGPDLPPGCIVDLSKPVPSRLDSVRDDISGLHYAAWCIGETLAACGGRDAMDDVYAAFEAVNGTRASSWLDHRWSGIVVGSANWCV